MPDGGSSSEVHQKLNRRDFIKGAGQNLAGLAVLLGLGKEGFNASFATGKETLSQVGSRLYEYVCREFPEVVGVLEHRPKIITEIQPSDVRRFTDIPPVESSFYTSENQEAIRRVGDGISKLYLGGRIDFVEMGQTEISLTQAEIVRLSKEAGTSILSMMDRKRKSLPRSIEEMVSNHRVRGALVTNELAVREILDGRSKYKNRNDPSEDDFPIKMVASSGDAEEDGFTYDINPQFEARARRKAEADFEYLVRQSETKEDFGNQKSDDFDDFLQKEFGDDNGNIAPEIARLSTVARKLSRTGEIDLDKIIKNVRSAKEFRSKIVKEIVEHKATVLEMPPIEREQAEADKKRRGLLSNLVSIITQTATRKVLGSSLSPSLEMEVALEGIVGNIVTPEVAQTFLARLPYLLHENPVSQLPGSTVIRDRKGEILYKQSPGVNREYVSIETIKAKNIKTFQAIKDAINLEDSRFFDHDGVDLDTVKGMVLSKMRGVNRGGSTLTQQVVKNICGLYLDKNREGLSEVDRKVSEMMLALTMERAYVDRHGSKEAAKEKILEQYINCISFGPNVVGIQTAAREFFNKEASELSRQEVIFLFSLIQNPNDRSFVNNKDRTVKKDGLDKANNAYFASVDFLKTKGIITPEESSQYSFPIQPNIYQQKYAQVYGQILGLAYSVDSVSKSRGIVIETTLDGEMQRWLTQKMDNESVNYVKQNGGVTDYSVFVRNNMGAVIASYQTNPGTIDRMVGSTSKPAMAMSLFERMGYDRNTIVSNEPPVFRLKKGLTYRVTSWTPDFDDKETPMSVPLGESLNSIFARKMLTDTGLDYLDMLERLGVGEIDPPEIIQSAPIGVWRSSPQRMINIIQTIANGGEACSSQYISRVRSLTGREIYTAPTVNPSKQRVLDMECAAQAAWILSTENQYGPWGSVGPSQVALKTGTASNPYDLENGIGDAWADLADLRTGDAVVIWAGRRTEDGELYGQPINAGGHEICVPLGTEIILRMRQGNQSAQF